MAIKGGPVLGWWCLFLSCPEEPRRFPDFESARDFWPPIKANSVWPPAKQVFKVAWQWHHREITPEWRNEIVRSNIMVMKNPTPYYAFDIVKQKLRLEEAAKKKAAKKKAKKPSKKKEGLN